MRRDIQRMSCTVLWKLRSVLAQFESDDSEESTRLGLAKERIFLRKKLQGVPWWGEGHRRLAEVELMLGKIHGGGTSPDLCAGISASLQAAEALSVEVDSQRKRFEEFMVAEQAVKR